jgi:hypothetical protein
MTKLTKFIPLSFVPNTTAATTTATISVPFKVKTIHVKSAGYTAGTLGDTVYVALMSDLVANNPLAILFQDTTYSSATVQDIFHTFSNPLDINGTFNFWLLNMDGSAGQTTTLLVGDPDKVGLIIEFDSPEEVI